MHSLENRCYQDIKSSYAIQRINSSQYISERFDGKKEKSKTYSLREEWLIDIVVIEFEQTPIG
jgi:hypothetical protein